MKEKLEQIIEEYLNGDQIRSPKSNFEAAAFMYNECEKTEEKLGAIKAGFRSAWKATTSGAKQPVIEAKYQSLYRAALELTVRSIELAIMAQRVIKAIRGEKT